MSRLRVLLVGDGPIPHKFMNYRGNHVYEFFSKLCYVKVICPRPQWATNNGENFRYVLPYRQTQDRSSLGYRTFQTLQLFLLVLRETQSGRYDIIRSLSFVPTLVSVIQPRRVPVMANIGDFYSDLYARFQLPGRNIVPRLVMLLEKLVAKKSSILIVDTEPQLEKWVSLGADRSKCKVLSHGVPLRERPSASELVGLKASLGLSENSPIIFFIGDISELDGVDILVKALPKVLSFVPEARAMIVGSGTKSYMAFLRELSRSLGVSHATIFIDRIPHDKISIYGSLASVCVAPFRLTPTSSTSLPNKILEYLSLGKPIVSSPGKGVASTLGNRIIYATPEDHDSLSEQIVGCLTTDREDPSPKIENSLTWEFIVQKEFELIRDLSRRM